MAAGIQIHNTAGILQINDSSVALAYMGKASGSVVAANALLGEAPGFISYNYGAATYPVVAYRSSSYKIRYVGHGIGGDAHAAVIFNPNYIPVNWTAYFFDIPNVTSNYGLNIYNSAGQLMFNGLNRLVSVVDTIVLNAGNGYTAQRSYTPGRTYAVIATGVYIVVSDHIVKCEGVLTSVAAAGGSFHVVVIDVTGY